MAEVRDEVEPQHRDGQDSALIGVTVGEGINHHVRGAGLVLNGGVKPEEHADPMVLRDHRKALVEEELEAIVVHSHQKTVAPEVWASMAGGVNEADELSFIGGERTVMSHDRPVEVGNRVLVLDEHRPEAEGQGVAFDDKCLGKVGQHQDRGRRDCSLERLEDHGSGVILAKPLLLQECHEGCRDGAVVMDEFVVVAR